MQLKRTYTNIHNYIATVASYKEIRMQQNIAADYMLLKFQQVYFEEELLYFKSSRISIQ